MHYVDYMKIKLSSLSERYKKIAVYGLGQVPPDFNTFINEYKNIKIINEEIKLHDEKYDCIFLSRVPEHFVNHYRTWNILHKLADNIVICVPNMNYIYQNLKENIKTNIIGRSLSFKTMRCIYEIYSELFDPYDSNFDLHKIYYSNTIFENKNFFKNFIPGFEIDYMDTNLRINSFSHTEIELKKINIKPYPSYCDKIELLYPVILCNPKYTTEANLIFDELQKIIPCTLNVTDQVKTIRFISLVSSISPRHIDYVFVILRNYVNQDTPIEIIDINKSELLDDIEFVIKDKDQNIEVFWEYNKLLFNTSSHCDPDYLKLVITQEDLFRINELGDNYESSYLLRCWIQ